VADTTGMAAAQKASRAGYDLEDVKVTFTADVATSVSGTDVSGREGDVLNLPRWVARALEGASLYEEMRASHDEFVARATGGTA